MSSLEASITLDDVFAVVAAKRVPLAAELAGYLALEIADGTDAGSGEVDPKTVFISEEGTVALVRPKKTTTTGDAEASVRQLLVRLLEASGSSTPALGQAAKRKPGNGLPALVEELEAALIPVNRAAGRRALARLSREVKRVTLGVGRNASAAPLPPAPAPAPAPPPKPEPAKTPPPEPARAASAPPPRSEPAPKTDAVRAATPQTEPEPKHDPLAPTPIAPKPKSTSIPPPPVKGAASGPPPAPPQPQRPPGPPSALHDLEEHARASEPPPPARASTPPPLPTPTPTPTPSPAPRVRNDAVDQLLGSFNVSNVAEDRQLARDLKSMAGLAPTPSAPDARTLAELADDVGKGPLPRQREGDSVEALLAMADASLPAPEVSANAALPAVNAKKSGPPSPIFGDAPRAGAAAAGAPASLRDREEQAPKKEKESERREEKRDAFKRTPPTEASDSAASTQRRRSFQDAPRAPKTSMGIMMLLLVLLAGATIAIYKYAPHVFVGRKPAPITPAVPAADAGSMASGQACRLTLIVTDAPKNAEILLRVGQAPVDVDQMPVGARLELVATAEGYAPRRSVIPAESVWDKGPDGKARIEVPFQLDPSRAKPGTSDPWPAGDPNAQAEASGKAGTVHVISNVRGAEIWLLAGLGPEARVEQRCDGDVDLLIASTTDKPGQGDKTAEKRKRIHVSDKRIAAAAPDTKGNKVVTVSAINGP